MNIFEELGDMPTCMEAAQELELITRLKTIPEAQISANSSEFRELIGDLAESHVDTGAFGVTEANERDFFDFAEWLRMLNRKAKLGIYDGDIEVFETSAADIARATERIRRNKSTA